MTDLMFSDVAHQMYIVEIIEESLYVPLNKRYCIVYRLSALITFYSHGFQFEGSRLREKKKAQGPQAERDAAASVAVRGAEIYCWTQSGAAALVTRWC